jgi:hypothetical protein
MPDGLDSILLKDETDEYQVTSVVAVPPTWRDIWSILRGRYKAKVQRRGAITTAGAGKVLKETFTPDIRDALNQKSLLFKEPDD